jgi:hypothetical protein
MRSTGGNTIFVFTLVVDAVGFETTQCAHNLGMLYPKTLEDSLESSLTHRVIYPIGSCGQVRAVKHGLIRFVLQLDCEITE